MLPIEKRIGALKQELEKLEEDRSKLAVIAPVGGIWDLKDLDDYKDRFVRQGDSIGLLLDTSSFDFLAVVSQEEVSRLFAGKPRSVSVRLNGDAFTEIPVENVMAIPAASDHLPSAALGWLAGGEIETRVNNAQNGEQTVEPVYIVRAQLNDSLLASFKRHGRTGKIRFDLGETPLAMQGIRKVRQALQKYYRM
jgi:putative peptide zinc metalloprotease protein